MPHSRARAEAYARAHERAAHSGIFRRVLQRFGGSHTHHNVRLVAEYAEAASLVEGFFHFLRNGHILYYEFCELQADFLKAFLHGFGYGLLEFERIPREVERGEFAFADRVGHVRNNKPFKVFHYILRGERGVGAEKFL